MVFDVYMDGYDCIDRAMICVTCLAPTESLYITYTNGHIQLTECSACHAPVDKYVERDNVVLFIDLLLLKPGAYRHLVYNSLEASLSGEASSSNAVEPGPGSPVQKGALGSLGLLSRLWILLLTFEIYLSCATEESRYALLLQRRSQGVAGWSILDGIHSRSTNFQYTYFALRSLLDILLFHHLLQYAVIRLCGWGRDVPHPRQVLSYTILLSYGAKIFPVLMLIWPYDTIISLDIIKWVANLYVIEALRVVTQLPYAAIVRVFIAVTLVRLLVVKSVMAMFLTGGDVQQTINYLVSECVNIVPRHMWNSSV